MSRPPRAALDFARPLDPTRRLLLGGVASTPLVGTETRRIEDPVVGVCETWLAQNEEHRRLALQWSTLEGELCRRFNFNALPRRQRAKLPEAQELDALDDWIDEIHAENVTRLALLPTMVATSIAGVAAKLAVATEELGPDDHEEVYQLLSSALRDLCDLAPGAWTR